jgi:hypothetical protein
VAAIDGRDLDPENGIYHQDTGITTYTLWGEITYQVSGIEGYQFLQKSDRSGVSLSTSATNNLVLVYSLASSSDTFAEETNELKELISASARQERVLTPSTDIEIYNIVKQRLFDSVNVNTANTIAKTYLQTYKTNQLNLPDSCKDATYGEAIAQSYPFYPELFNLLTKKIAAIQ